MTVSSGTSSSSAPAAPGFPQLLAILLALTVARLIGLHFSVVDFYFDEAQYWDWSRHLAFGYFSKPPLLAWILAGSQHICGSGEACLRAASPLFYLGISLVVYAIADELYGKETAFWSSLGLALLTGVSFSTRIISTDVPLLFFWTVALWAYLKLLARPDWRWAILLGLALGFGLLAKYAMAYFALGMGCAALLDRDAREVLRRPQTWIAFAIALALLSPNIYWNVANHFATVRHTGDNITGAGLSFRPLEALAFFASQFFVVGPLVFAAFLLILRRALLGKVSRQDRLLLAFAVPPLALVFALSFFRGANANWAAPAAVAMIILVTAWWLRAGYRRWLVASLIIGVAVQALFLIGDPFADRIRIAGLGRKGDLYERTLGWRSMGDNAVQLARVAGARTVAAEGRPELAALNYYLRNEPLAVVSWPKGAEAGNQFDLTQAIDDKTAEPVLFVTACLSTPRLERFFTSVSRLPQLVARSGPSTHREYYAYRLAGRKQSIKPLGPC